MTVQHVGQGTAVGAALREIEAERQRRELSRVDICDWGERRFYELEAVIERDLKAFVRVGLALLEIRGLRA